MITISVHWKLTHCLLARFALGALVAATKLQLTWRLIQLRDLRLEEGFLKEAKETKSSNGTALSSGEMAQLVGN